MDRGPGRHRPRPAPPREPAEAAGRPPPRDRTEKKDPDVVAPDAAALIEFVGQRIARYKKPKHVVFVERLPRTAVGAIDRAAVKAAHGG